MNTEQSFDQSPEASDDDLVWVTEVLAGAPGEVMPDAVHARILRAIELEQHRRVITDEFDPSASAEELDRKLAFQAGDERAAQAAVDVSWDSRSTVI